MLRRRALLFALLFAVACQAQSPAVVLPGMEPGPPQEVQGITQPALAQQEAAQGLGPAAAEVVGSCPQHSFYGENFYAGATLLEAGNSTDTVGACCLLCSMMDSCSKWAFCSATAEEGCEVPVGTLAGETFPPGTCLLSSVAATAGHGVRIAYSYLQVGVEWHSGEEAGDATDIQETAGGKTENWQKLSFDGAGALFCRTVAEGGPPVLTPLEGEDVKGPAVSPGQELGYTGLIVADAVGAEWAVVHSNRTAGVLWRYPAAALAFCATPQPSCPASGSSGRAEEGATCTDAADCCAGLWCTPRGVAGVQVSFKLDANSSSGGGTARSPLFGLQPGGSSLRALPNECSRGLVSGGTGPGELLFKDPLFDGLAVDWCRAADAECGAPAAAAFCRLNGYANAASYAGPVPVPRGNSTIYPESGSTCDTEMGGQCTTFYSITCALSR